MNRFILISMFCMSFFWSQAQEVKVESLNTEDFRLLQYEEWDLEYTSKGQVFSRFGVASNGIVLVSRNDSGYEIKMLDNQNLFVKSKSINFDIYKTRLGVPNLYINFTNLIFGPSNGKYIEIQSEQERFKKIKFPAKLRKYENSIPFQFKFTNTLELATSAVFSESEKEITYFLVDYSSSPYDTLYEKSDSLENLVFNNVNPSVQFCTTVDSDRILLLNNTVGELLLIDPKYGARKTLNLEKFDFNSSMYSKDYSLRLIKDFETDIQYLYHNPLGGEKNRLFIIDNEDFTLDEVVISKLATHNLQVFNHKIFDIFYIESLESNAIYSIPLKLD